MKTFNINRRQFIQGATASLALATLGVYGLDLTNPQKRLRVALIGTGWYGKSDLFRLMQVSPVDVVGLCDVDQNLLKEASELLAKRDPSQKPRLYHEYQKMLSENQPDLTLIGTPDHWHALQAIDAIKTGSHVYLQKPISVDVIEGEAVVAAARKYKKVVQVGTQRRSTPHLIEAKRDIVDAGKLGKISHVELFCYYHMRNNSNPPLQPVPKYLDYELWTGPAPLRPYDGIPHRGWWRSFMEYGNGIMGDMCIHMLDATRWMLGLGWPKKITSTGGIWSDSTGKSNISDTQTAIFEFDNLTCVWQHRTWGTPVDPEYPWGYKIYGEKGTLSCSPYTYDFVPVGEGKKIHGDALYEREKFPEDVTEKDIEIHAAPATRLHMLNLLASIKDGGRPVADIEEGHISTASCIVANLSMRLKRPLSYNPNSRSVEGDPEATRLLQRAYRNPWVHPDPAKV